MALRRLLGILPYWPKQLKALTKLTSEPAKRCASLAPVKGGHRTRYERPRETMSLSGHCHQILTVQSEPPLATEYPSMMGMNGPRRGPSDSDALGAGRSLQAFAIQLASPEEETAQIAMGTES